MPITQSRMITLLKLTEFYERAVQQALDMLEAEWLGAFSPPEVELKLHRARVRFTPDLDLVKAYHMELYHFKKHSVKNSRDAARKALQRIEAGRPVTMETAQRVAQAALEEDREIPTPKIIDRRRPGGLPTAGELKLDFGSLPTAPQGLSQSTRAAIEAEAAQATALSDRQWQDYLFIKTHNMTRDEAETRGLDIEAMLKALPDTPNPEAPPEASPESTK